MTSVCFNKEINALLHINSYFFVQFCHNFDLDFLGVYGRKIPTRRFEKTLTLSVCERIRLNTPLGY